MSKQKIEFTTIHKSIGNSRRSVVSPVIRIAVIILTLALASATAKDQNEPHDRPKVVVLNSYHPGYFWSDQVMNAIKDTFEHKTPDIELLFEYMDTKLHDDVQLFPLLKKIYQAKYQNEKIDVIIASDDNAILFLLENRDELCPNIPLVFCGASKPLQPILEKQKLITGIMELEDIDLMLDTALKLHPKAQKAIIIADEPADAELYVSLIEETIQPQLSRKINLEGLAFLKPTPLEFGKRLKSYTDDSFIYLVRPTRFWGDGRYPVKQVPSIIHKLCNLPIYGSTEWWTGTGVIGININDAENHGRIAAERAIRIINGTDINNLPIISKPSRKLVFDYTEMKKFGIAASDLPDGSTIINKPVPFYYQYRIIILPALLAIVILLLAVITLSIIIIVRKRREERFLEINERVQGKIGRELHDSLGQQLTGLRYLNDILLEQLEKESSPYIADAKRISEILRQSIKQSGEITRGLYPSDLHQQGLLYALKSLAENMSGIIGTTCTFESDESVKIHDIKTALHLYRITQEAINNAIKHGKAKKIYCKLLSQKNSYVLSIDDNGVGFPNKGFKEGLGLQSIRYRTKAIGGTLDIQSNGSGTTLICSFPIPKHVLDRQVEYDRKNI